MLIHFVVNPLSVVLNLLLIQFEITKNMTPTSTSLSNRLSFIKCKWSTICLIGWKVDFEKNHSHGLTKFSYLLKDMLCWFQTVQLEKVSLFYLVLSLKVRLSQKISPRRGALLTFSEKLRRSSRLRPSRKKMILTLIL